MADIGSCENNKMLTQHLLDVLGISVGSVNEIARIGLDLGGPRLPDS
jgi:hypothetical protein